MVVKCNSCQKKIKGLMEFKCKCEKIVCQKCRLPENHNCQFDFKKERDNIQGLGGGQFSKVEKI